MYFKEYVEIYKKVADIYSHVLLHTEEGERALNYLKERGFSLETIQEFGYGYSFKGNMITNYLQKQGYNMDDLVAIGLVKKFDKEPFYRDIFYGRVMIPLKDENGNAIGFSGRLLPNSTHSEKYAEYAKYVNTAETEHFKKGEILYNLNTAKDSIKQNAFAIMLEGYFDVSMVKQKVCENVVGTMGTALTLNQVLALKKYTNRVILCFDGDKAGLAAMKGNAELLLQNNVDVRIAVLPNELDPHEFLMMNDKNSFIQEVVLKANTYYGYMFKYLKQDKDMTKEVDRLMFINEMLDILRFADIDKQREMYNYLANEMKIDNDQILRHLSFQFNF